MMIFDFECTQTKEWILENYSSKRKFIKCFKNNFSHVRCYHFGKIFSFDTFSENLQISDFSLLAKRAKCLFNDGVNNDLIDGIIEKYTYTDHGKLFFYLTKGILKKAVMYIIQGSETLFFIVQDIEKINPNLNVRQKLYTTGTPVIYHLNVPIEDFMIKNINAIYEIITENEINDISENEDLGYDLYLRK